MRETPAQYNEAIAKDGIERTMPQVPNTTLASPEEPGSPLLLLPEDQRGIAYPMDALARYRYHTGAKLKPLAPQESCPVLFRDIGSVAMASFLRGELERLAGPYSPITYMRTEAYQEPYVDYGKIGRLVFLRPLEVHPWHSGIPHIYISRATRMTSPNTLGYVPGDMSLREASQLLSEAPDTNAVREILGGRLYDQRCAHALQQLDQLNDTLAKTEALALPLRRLLQSPQSDDNRRARELMDTFSIDESDLCAAWHHLPDDKRLALEDAFQRLAAELP